MTKSDVLSFLDEIKVCTAYKVNGQLTQNLPYDLEADIEPVYQTFPAWKEDLTGITDKNDLPDTLHGYIHWLEQCTGLPITILSVGPDRAQTLDMAEG